MAACVTDAGKWTGLNRVSEKPRELQSKFSYVLAMQLCLGFEGQSSNTC